MVALRAIGALERFETLPPNIEPAQIFRVPVPELRYTWEASLTLLPETKADPGLARALNRRLYGRRARIVHLGAAASEKGVGGGS